MIQRLKHILLAIAICSLVSLAVFSLGTKAQGPEPTTLQVGLIKGPSGIGALHIVKKPELNSKSIMVQLLPSVDAVTAKILTQELDFAVLPVNVAAKLYNSGIDYPALAVIGNGMVQILTNNTDIKSFADLAGKSIYVAGQGATPEYLLRTIARFYKIPVYTQNESKPDGITMIFSMPYPEMAASLAAGKIETAVLPEPFATVARLNNNSLREPFSLAADWTKATGQKDYPMTLLVVKGSLVRQYPSLVSQFMKYYEQSMQAVIANPGEAGTLAEELGFGLKASVVKASIPKSNYVFITAPNAKQQITAMLSVFLQESPDSIGNKLPDNSFYCVVK